MLRPILAAALLLTPLALTEMAPPALAQSAQRVCSVQIVAEGPRRVGEGRAREAALEEFGARLIRHHGAVNPFDVQRGIGERTVAVTCRRDNARQSCVASGQVCVLTRAAPACLGPQRIDADGIHDTCRVDASRSGSRGAYIASSAFARVRCPSGYEVRVRQGQDTCRLPGY